jgi:hypothetical protein
MLAGQKMIYFIHKGYEIHNCDSLLKYKVNINNIYKLSQETQWGVHCKDQQVNDHCCLFWELHETNAYVVLEKYRISVKAVSMNNHHCTLKGKVIPVLN